MSSSSLYRVSGIVLIIAAVLVAIASVATTFTFPDTGPGVPASAVTSTAWSVLTTSIYNFIF